MSNTYVKKYDVGQVKVDLPSATYIHELPLLSFGDVLHTINLSLVYNHKMYRDGINTSFINPGFRINLQKQINFENNIPKFLQDENGQCVPLTYWNSGALYTFEDDSKRILRRLGSTYELENPDRSKEYYSEAGRITSIVDKYGETILLYTYNGSNQLISITYRGTKTIEFGYLANKLYSITYAGKTTTIGYDDTRLTVAHYSDVDYHFNTSYNNFVVYSTDAGEEYSDTCSRKYICSVNGNTLVASKVVCGTNVDTTTYNFWDYSEATSVCNFVDVTDKFGVTSRIQLENRKPAYSYELTDNFFDGEAMGDPIYTGTVFSHNSKDIMGPQSKSSGLKLEEMVANYWHVGITSRENITGRLVLSGWMNVASSDSCTFTIRKPGIPDHEYCVTHSVPVIKDQTWQYFAFSFNINNMIEITVTTDIPTIYLKDLRLTFQSGTILSETPVYVASVEDVFIHERSDGDKILTIDECKFYIGNTLLNQKVTCTDVLKYKINQMYRAHSNEIYYDDCKGVTVRSNPFVMKYDEGDATYTVPVTSLAVGTKKYKKAKEYITKTNFYTVNDSTHLMSKSFTSAGYYKEDVYDEYLNLISSTVEGVTTTYVRNSKGMVTSQKITAIGTTEEIVTSASYDDNCTKVISTTNEFGVTTTYQTDEVWGLINQAFVDGNNVVSNEYDMNKLALTKKLFSSDANGRNNTLDYSNGRLSSLTSNTLNYTFEYTPKDELASVSKNNNLVETHNYCDNVENTENTEKETVVYNNYENSHSEIQHFDEYGRLKNIEDVLINTYSISATYNDDPKITNDIVRYEKSDTDDITGKLATTQDLTRGETLKYAYENGQLSRVATVDITGIIKEEMFEYDVANRLTEDRLCYEANNQKIFKSVIEYEKEESDPTADGKVKKYSCYLNNSTSPIVETENTFDSFNRVDSKCYRMNGKEFKKEITYDKTRPSNISDKLNNVEFANTSYEYDNMGRISSVSTGGQITSYTYDEYGQLIEETNSGLDKTFQYEYNGIGNISKLTTNGTIVNFGYTNDRLTSYNGKTITYNANGAVKSYDGWNYTWNKGKLSGISKTSIGSIARAAVKPITTSTKNYTFTYNALGQRTNSQYSHTWTASGLSPVQPGDVTGFNRGYTYDHSGRLIRETISTTIHGVGTESSELVYLYDENSIVGIQYTKGSTSNAYYFQRNLFGDVVAIYDTNGTKVVEYAYDAWGNCTIKGTTTNYVVAHANPIRYRGYYYDADTNLYYINARYYSPEWRRFISPDDTAYLNPKNVNGLNLYCYGNNNPINVQYSTLMTHENNIRGKMIISILPLVTAGTTSFNIVGLNYNKLLKNALLSLSEVSGTLFYSLTNNGQVMIKYHQIFDGVDGFTTLNSLPHPVNNLFKGLSIGLSVVDTLNAGFESYNSGHSLGQGVLNVALTGGKNYVVYKASTYVTTAVGKWVGTKLGASIGSWAGPVGTVVGVAIGTLAGYLIDEFGDDIIDWIIGCFD